MRDAFFFLSLAGLGLSVADRPGRSVAQTGLLELALILWLLHPVNLFLRVLRSFEPRVVEG